MAGGRPPAARAAVFLALWSLSVLVTHADRGDEDAEVAALVAPALKAMAAAGRGSGSDGPLIKEEADQDTDELASREATFVGPLRLATAAQQYFSFRSAAVMMMVLFSFGKIVWGSIAELRKLTNALHNTKAEEQTPPGDARPIAPRAFAAAEAAAAAAAAARRCQHIAATATPPAASPGVPPPPPAARASGRRRAPLAMQPQAGRRSHSEPAARSTGVQPAREAAAAALGRPEAAFI
eukprot:TRINITY_DN16220_c0_g1_i1.p1 TRINITY_DN16220_c0_g1~~TRINITY_DN16220_c0_g1_i1.p1  ORF type:complete len:238 (+),score=66.16 TRINITY_DN16220_c0_g1_i1:132-845(+)